MLTIDGQELPEEGFVDNVTNTALSDFPVQCVFRTADIQQPFLHSHEGYEWYLCLSGSGRFIVGGRVHHIGPGTLLVIRPLALHMPRSVAGEPFHRFILSTGKGYLDHAVAHAVDDAAGAAIAKWLPRPGRDYSYWQLNARQLLSLQDILTRLEQEIGERRECFSLAVYSLVLQFFVGLGRHVAKPVAVQQGSGERKRLVEEMMGHVAEQYREPFRMEDLCRRFHLSRSYLHRVFKRETGVTFTEYLIAYRVNKAKGLLESGRLPLAEVALASGFQDLSHFCHMFKRLTGVTPGRYRISRTTVNGHDA